MICIECGETREGEFYPYNKSRCKHCCNKRTVQVYSPRRRDKQAEYYQLWYQENGRQRAIDYSDKIVLWQRMHPEEVEARRKLEWAIEKGEIIKPDFCSACLRKIKVQGHHPDYSKPLEVIWLCASCHKKVHLREQIKAEA